MFQLINQGFPTMVRFTLQKFLTHCTHFIYGSGHGKNSDYDVQELMSAYWIQFIKTGNPNGKGLPDWNSYNKTDGAILEIDSTTILKPAFLKKEFELLEQLEQDK